MSSTDLDLLTLIDCESLLSRVRESMRSHHDEAVERFRTDFTDLVGIVGWSLPLDAADEQDLQTAFAHFESHRSNVALEIIDLIIQRVRKRIASRG